MKISVLPLACLLCLALLVHADAPMRDEDVVLLFVSGTPVSQIIERIDTAATDFDLSDEMVDELRLAGLPGELLEAMKRRQREQSPPDDTTEPIENEPAAPAPAVVIRLTGDGAEDGAGPVIRASDRLPPDTLTALGLDADARVTDVAVVLACLTAYHVPDHWRGETPLGRDFVGTPRHRMLSFVPGAETTDPARGPRWIGALKGEDPKKTGPQPKLLELHAPARLEGLVATDESHDVLVGVALEVGGRWFLAASATAEAVAPDGNPLNASIASGPDGLEVTFED